MERFERIAGEEQVSPEILLEVNVSGEASKGGMTPKDLPEIASVATRCVNIKFKGLMTMAPFNADQQELISVFSGLCDLKSGIEKNCNINLPCLSMGMSGDFAEAIACGATVVRVGSRIFEGIERIAK